MASSRPVNPGRGKVKGEVAENPNTELALHSYFFDLLHEEGELDDDSAHLPDSAFPPIASNLSQTFGTSQVEEMPVDSEHVNLKDGEVDPIQALDTPLPQMDESPVDSNESSDSQNSGIPTSDSQNQNSSIELAETSPFSVFPNKLSPPTLVSRHRIEPKASPIFAPSEKTLAKAEKDKLQNLLNQNTTVTETPPIVEQKVEAESPIKVEMPKVETKTDTTLKVQEAKAVSVEAKTTNEDLKQDLDTHESLDESFGERVLARKQKFIEWGENGRPLWAQERFDVLTFDVSGLLLAVPLVSLGQIVTMTEELTPLFGQSDWFMGLLPSVHGEIRTINTALFVMPDRYNDDLAKEASYVISIDGHQWGLAVNSVHQPISLEPDEVKWRSQRSTRPWLAGTIKSKMCALIDIPNMAEMLEASDKNKVPPSSD